MRALVYDGSQLELEYDIPTPIPQSDQALLKIRQAGICNTDLELIAGYKGFSGVLGHEFVADVVDGPSEFVGKRVVGEINVACGDCDFCKCHIPSQCLNRTAVGIFQHPGAFADYLSLTVANLHVLPQSISDDQAIFVEPLAAALQVTEAVHISPRDRVVVVGAGKLGMLVAQLLRLTGAKLIVVVRRQAQVDLLRKWQISPVAYSEITKRNADIVVDCTGTADGLKDSLTIVKPRGIIILKSTYHGNSSVNLSQISVDEIKVVGSRCGPFDAALRLLSAGLVDVRSLIEVRYEFNDALKAMKHAKQVGVMKVILEM